MILGRVRQRGLKVENEMSQLTVLIGIVLSVQIKRDLFGKVMKRQKIRTLLIRSCIIRYPA